MKCTCCGAQLEKNERACHYCGEPSIQEPYIPPEARQPQEPDHIYIEHHHHYYEQRPDHIYVDHHYVRPRSSKNRLTLLLLCVFLGRYGVHKFYQGKVGSGIAYLLTHGWFYIGWIVDICSIACGNPVDGDGLPIKW